MKYLTAKQLQQFTEIELDSYAYDMMQEQLKILEAIDTWSDYYGLASDEYDRRRGTSKRIIMKNDSETKH